MNKVLRLFIAVVGIVFLCGCYGKDSTTEIKVIAPQNNAIPFEGTWHIVKFINKGAPASSKDAEDNWIGRKAEFLKGGVKVGNDIWKDPHYKIKTVETREYFLYKYGVSAEELSLKESLVDVITITSGDKFLYEFIKLNDDEAIFFVQDKIFSLKKISDRVESNFTEELKIKKKDENSRIADSKEEPPSSGVLLGIRYNKAEGAYGYKTLWIASKNFVLYPVLETDNIFLPRMNGFWKLEHQRVRDNNRVEDIIRVCSPSQLKKNEPGEFKIDVNRWGNREGTVEKKILYIGNDYISMEVTGKGGYTNNSGKWEESQFQVKPVDNISGDRNVKMSDLEGINGLKMLEEASGNSVGYSDESEGENISRKLLDENFYLQRRMGRWVFKGRMSLDKGGRKTATDYNINIIPPQSLVSFDILCVLWSAIKDRVPDAVDAYTSPNKDMAVILSSSRLYIYSIENGELGKKPLAKVRLAEGDSVVMAEWGMDWYVDKWEEAFMRNDFKRVITE